MIVQEYVDKPFLLEGFKFDLRVYVLVTSCDPLRIFLYPDGLVRMGTEQYLAPTDNNVVSSTGSRTGNSVVVCVCVAISLPHPHTHTQTKTRPIFFQALVLGALAL